MLSGGLRNQRFQTADILMLMDFICNHYGNQLGNSGKQQVCMESLFIVGFAPGNTETILEMADRFFHIHPHFIDGIPFRRVTDCSGISTEVLCRIDINHSSAGRSRTWVITMTHSFCFLCDAVPFPFHFGADKFHGREPAA